MPNSEKVTILNADNTPVNTTNPLAVSISGSGGGDVEVVGNVAAGASDSGNPVKIGGKYNSTQPTLTNGQRGDAQLDTRANLKAAIFGADQNTGVHVGFTTGDGYPSSNAVLGTRSLGFLYDGVSAWNRWLQGGTGSALVENGPYTSSRVIADGQVKATAGFIHTVTFSPTGSVTAGTITIYNSASESGTIVFSCALPATTFTPFSVVLDVVCGTGIYVGYDGTVANVQTTVSFR